MNILALETSTEHCSLALLLNDQLFSKEILAGQRHSELLLPLLQTLLTEADITLPQIDGIAFGAGPGSFTGLRIACGVAQGLAFAHELPVIGISTLTALAEQTGATRVLTVLDARMQEVYFAACEKTTHGWQFVHTPQLCRPDAVPTVNGSDWVGCGSGFDLYHAVLSTTYTENLRQTLTGYYPRAQEIARLAAIGFSRGEGGAPETALPVYIRNKIALKENER